MRDWLYPHNDHSYEEAFLPMIFGFALCAIVCGVKAYVDYDKRHP
jgi:hypothetical protein